MVIGIVSADEAGRQFGKFVEEICAVGCARLFQLLGKQRSQCHKRLKLNVFYFSILPLIRLDELR